MSKHGRVQNADQLHAIEKTKIALIRLAGYLLWPFGQFGLYRLCSYLAKLNRSSIDYVRLSMYGGKFTFAFPSNDPYWLRLLSHHYYYEPEIAAMLRIVGDRDFAFLDCGANYGYWSLYASSMCARCVSTISVEASPVAFEMLRFNQAINHMKIAVLQRAIAEVDKRELDFAVSRSVSGMPGDHAIGNLPLDGDRYIAKVESITVDSLARLVPLDFVDTLVIKLDVEGHECHALRGATDTLDRFEFLIAYECHGKDPKSTVSRFILEELGLAVFHYTPSGAFQQVSSASEITRLKLSRFVGYNFFACRAGGRMFHTLAGSRSRR